MATSKHPFTAEHLREFRLYVKHWQKQLNLVDWRFSVKKGRHKDVAQVTEISLVERLAKIVLGRDGDPYPITAHRLNQLAFHEVMHVRLHELKAFVHDTGMIDHEDVISCEHAIINPLLLVLMPSVDPKDEL
jgi:hypothetical protein